MSEKFNLCKILFRKLLYRVVLPALSAVSVLCGCTLSRPLDELLSAPRLTAEQEKIYQALTASKGTKIGLKYPKSGAYSSAFVFRDLNSDGIDEALVFYEIDGQALLMSLLDKTGGEWRNVSDVSFKGSDIERIVFTDLSDNNQNLIVNYSISSTTAGADKQYETGLAVYRYTNGALVRTFDNVISSFDITDIDDDGGHELFLIRQQAAGVPQLAPSVTGYFYVADGDALINKYSAPLNPAATSYLRIMQGYVFGNEETPKTKALFIDFAAGIEDIGQVYNVDCLYVYNGTAVNGIYEPPDLSGTTDSELSAGTSDGDDTKHTDTADTANTGADNTKNTGTDNTGADSSVPIPAVSHAAAKTETTIRRPNLHTADVMSTDIDNDGITEIASTSVFPGYENYREQRMRAIIWYTLTGDPANPRLSEKRYSYYSMKGDYVFYFPARWERMVTVKTDGDDIVFCEYTPAPQSDDINAVFGAELLRIRTVENAASAVPQGFRRISAASVISVKEEPAMGLTADETAECFKIIANS